MSDLLTLSVLLIQTKKSDNIIIEQIARKVECGIIWHFFGIINETDKKNL